MEENASKKKQDEQNASKKRQEKEDARKKQYEIEDKQLDEALLHEQQESQIDVTQIALNKMIQRKHSEGIQKESDEKLKLIDEQKVAIQKEMDGLKYLSVRQKQQSDTEVRNLLSS